MKQQMLSAALGMLGGKEGINKMILSNIEVIEAPLAKHLEAIQPEGKEIAAYMFTPIKIGDKVKIMVSHVELEPSPDFIKPITRTSFEVFITKIMDATNE